MQTKEEIKNRIDDLKNFIRLSRRIYNSKDGAMYKDEQLQTFVQKAALEVYVYEQMLKTSEVINNG